LSSLPFKGLGISPLCFFFADWFRKADLELPECPTSLAAVQEAWFVRMSEDSSILSSSCVEPSWAHSVGVGKGIAVQAEMNFMRWKPSFDTV